MDLDVTELKRLKMLEDENARLKRIVADLTLDKQILQEVVRKKLCRLPKRRELDSRKRKRRGKLSMPKIDYCSSPCAGAKCTYAAAAAHPSNAPTAAPPSTSVG